LRKWGVDLIKKFGAPLLIALLLSAPVISLYTAHLIWAERKALLPTWFIAYDMPYYMANAHQYIDGQSKWGFYSNPYDFKKDSPCIYFQPHILFLAFISWPQSVDPGAAFALFGFAATILAFLILQKLINKYCHSVGCLKAYLLILISWGGGCLALLGFLIAYIEGESITPFRIDPFQGGWFLNLGRNFVFPTEAYYHLVVLSIFYFVLSRRVNLVFWGACLLVISHPFTGLQYAIILFVWVSFERFFMDSKIIPTSKVFLFLIPILYAFLYYLLFLSFFPAHRSLMEQWKLPWSINIITIIGAYGFVGLLTFLRCSNIEKFKKCFSDPFSRFLGCSAIISFILANHEFLIQPIQPIHFTRGHVWLPLAILSLPMIVSLWKKSVKQYRKTISNILILGLASIMLSDNLIYFIINTTRPAGIYLSQAEAQIINIISKHFDGAVIVSDNEKIDYLLPVYTDARPYVGHWANTPFIKRKKENKRNLFSNGIIAEDLCRGNLIVNSRRDHINLSKAGKKFECIYTSKGYSIFKLN
jgi:hypothetical protein